MENVYHFQMLYGTNASRSSSEGGDRDYAPDPITGLGAVTPSRRPGVTTSGGGYAPAGGGPGGTPGAGEQAVAGSRTATFKPEDRSTSIPLFAARGKARYSFEKSGRSSRLSVGQLRLSPISPIPTAWGGLHGLDSWLSDRFKGAKRIVTPSPLVRKAVRYTGAGAATVLSGGFLPQPFVRKTFGLSPGESAQSEIGLKVMRGITTAVATAGAVGYFGGVGPLASLSPKLAVASPGTILPPATLVTNIPASGAALYSPLSLSATPAAAPIQFGTGTLIATKASVAALPPATGFWGTVGGGLSTGAKALGSGVGAVGKAVAVNVGTQALISKLGPQSQEQTGQVIGGPGSGDNSIFQPTAAGQTGGGGGGEAQASEQPIQAGMSPWIILGLAGVGLALLTGKTKLNRK